MLRNYNIRGIHVPNKNTLTLEISNGRKRCSKLSTRLIIIITNSKHINIRNTTTINIINTRKTTNYTKNITRFHDAYISKLNSDKTNMESTQMDQLSVLIYIKIIPSKIFHPQKINFCLFINIYVKTTF